MNFLMMICLHHHDRLQHHRYHIQMLYLNRLNVTLYLVATNDRLALKSYPYHLHHLYATRILEFYENCLFSVCVCFLCCWLHFFVSHRHNFWLNWNKLLKMQMRFRNIFRPFVVDYYYYYYRYKSVTFTELFAKKTIKKNTKRERKKIHKGNEPIYAMVCGLTSPLAIYK